MVSTPFHTTRQVPLSLTVQTRIRKKCHAYSFKWEDWEMYAIQAIYLHVSAQTRLLSLISCLRFPDDSALGTMIFLIYFYDSVQVGFVQILTSVPPYRTLQSHPRTRADGRALNRCRFWFKVLLTSHSWLPGTRQIQIHFSPVTFWPHVVCNPLLFVHQDMYNILWYLRICVCCLFTRRIELNQ